AVVTPDGVIGGVYFAIAREVWEHARDVLDEAAQALAGRGFVVELEVAGVGRSVVDRAERNACPAGVERRGRLEVGLAEKRRGLDAAQFPAVARAVAGGKARRAAEAIERVGDETGASALDLIEIEGVGDVATGDRRGAGRRVDLQ